MLRGIEAQRRREEEPMLNSVLCGLDDEGAGLFAALGDLAKEARR